MASKNVLIPSSKVVKIFVLLFTLFIGLQIYQEVLKDKRTVETNLVPLHDMRAKSSSASVMRTRAKRLNSKCKGSNPALAHNYYQYLCAHIQENRRLGVSWCYVPKAGSTFWKKVFYILQTSTSQGEAMIQLDDIGFRQAHSAPVDNMCYLPANKVLAAKMSSQRTLLVVRDPYSRLFSAYVDKLYLPDHWSTVGIHIVKHFRQNATNISKQCGSDVTFKEFIDYVIHVGKTGRGVQWFYDDHWQPISKICQPCEVPYKYIAKQETFSSDRDALLEELQIEKYINGSFLEAEENIVRRISEKIRAYWTTGFKTGCISPLKLMQRMWTAFQIQGYLPFSIPLHDQITTSSKTVSMETFRGVVISVFKKYLKINLKGQRLSSMITGYRRLSRDQMKEIINIYNSDFDLFEYDKEPEYLYKLVS